MERIVHLNDEPGQTGELIVEHDANAGRVRSIGTGFWSVDQASAFFKDWERIVRRIHANGVRLIAAVDLAEGGVQKAEVASIIATATDGLYHPGDAIAMIVENSLAKMQMRRVLDAQFHEFFMSKTAAETWLQGKSQAKLQGRT